MRNNTQIVNASESDAAEISLMVGELLAEIMDAIGVQAFHFDLEAQRKVTPGVIPIIRLAFSKAAA